MNEREYPAFRADVAARGVRVPLEITAAGVVLDGRQRLRAAHELDLEYVPVRLIEVEDELDYMRRAAICRRHLSASQVGALLVEMDGYDELRTQAEKRQRANLRQASEVATLPPRGKTRDVAARWARVCARTIQDAATVKQHDPDLFEQVKCGDIGAADAARRVRRALRDQALPPPPPLPSGPFELIYADPPWQLGSPNSAKAPENHYPTLELEEIKQLAPPAANDAILFLWAVNALLPQALEVITAWGFEYRTNLVWVKPRIGLGTWTRNQHELLLCAIRGKFPAPDTSVRPASVVEAPSRKHSEKPRCVYQLLERAYPRASKLELFARDATRPGWAAWGNEVKP